MAVDGVRLHVLEWGPEDAEALVLLPGLGQGAWIYSDLAPLLADRFRVVAMAPRGHGRSETPGDGYTVARFAADLGGVLDGLGVARAALAAHSVGATWGTRFAAEQPERVSAMVYLDGVVDYGRFPAVQARMPFRAPPSPQGDPAAEREWVERHVYGFWCAALEADWRARADDDRRLHLADLLEDASAEPQPYGALRAPALALVPGESVETVFPWLDPGDAAVRARAEDFLLRIRGPWRRAAVERFRREAPEGRVSVITGHHALFLGAPERVAAEIRAFVPSPLEEPGE